MQNTIKQYDTVIKACRELFHKKMKDYGSAWRILRLSSLTDQIFIKAQRIRGLQKNNVRKIDEGQSDEFIGIVNYSIMALIQLDKGVSEEPDIDLAESLVLYDEISENTKNLMLDKNHDYGEAWREMRVSSLTDLIMFLNWQPPMIISWLDRNVDLMLHNFPLQFSLGVILK